MKKKKLKPKRKEVSKQRILTYSMGGFIILLMVASAMNMWKGDQQETYNYKGIKFTKTEQGFWVGYNGNQRIVLNYNPKDLEKISLPQNIGALNLASKIYLTTNDLKQNARPMDYFKRKIGITNMKPYACVEDKDGCEELPLKSCEDSTETEAVVLFKRSDETKVTFKNNCLILEGTSENLIKAVDHLYFTLSGL